VLQLQIVAGFSPLEAGVSTLPITVIMLLLSARAGRLASRIGPRIPMTVGLLAAAGGMLLLLRVDVGASYLVDVLPAVLLFGLGLAGTVAPLTAAVLDAADDRHAGVASGVNNAVARAAGLLAVAVIPAAAGIAGADYTDPAAFSAGYHRAVVIAACLLVGGAVLSAVLLRSLRPRPSEDIPLAECAHCGIASPQQYPRS
jgi:MFS family permease